MAAPLRNKRKRIRFRIKVRERRAQQRLRELGKIGHLDQHAHTAATLRVEMAEDGSARQPNDRAVARDEIEEVHLRRVERKNAGRFLAEGEKQLGTQNAAANQQ